MYHIPHNQNYHLTKPPIPRSESKVKTFAEPNPVWPPINLRLGQSIKQKSDENYENDGKTTKKLNLNA